MTSAMHKGVESSERHGAILGPFVVPDPGEGRRAHVAVLRELEEVRLDDDLRFRPESAVRVNPGALRDRASLLLQGDEPLEERPPQLLGEAGPDPADVEERALEVRSEDQRPERVLALAFARGDPADDRVEGRLLLDLDPVLAPLSDLITGLLVFRDDALETARDDRVVVVDPAALDVIAQDDPVVDLDEIRQDRLALHLGEAHDGLVPDVEDIENDVRRGKGLCEILNLDLAARPLPLLEFLETGQRPVHNDDLPVEDRRLPRVDREVRVPRFDIIQAPVLKPKPVAHDGQGPGAIPLQLEDVVLRIEGSLAALREHRLDHVEVRVERRHPFNWPSRPRGLPSTRP